jgi:hypothetical protein
MYRDSQKGDVLHVKVHTWGPNFSAVRVGALFSPGAHLGESVPKKHEVWEQDK